MQSLVSYLIVTLSMALVSACGGAAPPASDSLERGALVGAWRSHIRFSAGAFAEMKDLEFMYVHNAGGTMTESSNYDGAPPVPPAYGVWKKTGAREFETKYLFYVTKPPGTRFVNFSASRKITDGGRAKRGKKALRTLKLDRTHKITLTVPLGKDAALVYTAK